MDQPIAFEITPEKEASKLQFLRRQFSAGAPSLSRRDVDLSGKTAIVTGANGGIGLQCSRQLLELGLTKLIMAVRNKAKGEAARQSLMGMKTLASNVVIEVWKLDCASYDSVTAFAQHADQLSPRIDIAILNAGVHRVSFAQNPTTGHEENLQTNYLSNVLLMLLLLRTFSKKVESGAADLPGHTPGRIVLVSSDTAAWTKFTQKDRNPLLPAFDEKPAKFDHFDSYATSKLLGQLFLTELARRVPPSVAVINCANPGLCYSGLQRELGLFPDLVIRLFGRSSAAGARTLMHAALKLDESSHGHYVEDGHLRPMAPFVYSRDAPQVIKRLWKETMGELAFAGVQDIVDGLGRA